MKQWMEVNGATLCYELGGAKGRETVVFLHEGGGCIESWDEALPEFQEHFCTLAYDQRGFGQSEKIRHELTYDMIVGDLAGLLDGLGITGSCHLVGSALGTAYAMGFAAKYPQRVARLAMASPVIGHIHSTPERRIASVKRAESVQRDGMRAWVDASMASGYPEVLRGNRGRYEACRARWLATDPWCYAAQARMSSTINLTPQLAKIECPTLVLGATYDPQRTPAVAKEIAGQIRGARYAEIASGHFAAVETPELFAELVVPFLLGS